MVRSSPSWPSALPTRTLPRPPPTHTHPFLTVPLSQPWSWTTTTPALRAHTNTLPAPVRPPARPRALGKSTLLRLIMEREKPNAGTVRLGEHNIVPNYFEQNQAEALDLELTVLDTLVKVREGGCGLQKGGEGGCGGGVFAAGGCMCVPLSRPGIARVPPAASAPPAHDMVGQSSQVPLVQRTPVAGGGAGGTRGSSLPLPAKGGSPVCACCPLAASFFGAHRSPAAQHTPSRLPAFLPACLHAPPSPPCPVVSCMLAALSPPPPPAPSPSPTQASPDAKLNDLKALLGRMLFSGTAMEKKVGGGLTNRGVGAARGAGVVGEGAGAWLFACLLRGADRKGPRAAIPGCRLLLTAPHPSHAHLPLLPIHASPSRAVRRVLACART